jgi:ubiquinone/menaquinone biosynthesis C-methylase UbiE
MAIDFSSFDQRNYKTVGVNDGYAEWADVYESSVLEYMDTTLLERLALPWKNFTSAVDLACGTGRIGAWLHEQGVSHIDGVDITPEMMEQAQNRKTYKNLHLADVRTTNLPANQYQLAINSLSNEHLEDLDPFFREIDRVTSPGAHVIIIGYHPVFMFFDNANGESIAITNYIHLFSDHIQLAGKMGWRLQNMHERLVDSDFINAHPSYKKHEGYPISYLLHWSKERNR